MENEEKHLLIEVSVMYYLEGKTQNQIAKELFISRPKVSRLLKKAREEDIVNIKINYDCDELTQLKNKIMKKFNLENVIIVKTLSNYNDTLKELGKAAAVELYDQLRDDMTIGISWGRSVRNTVNYLKEKPLGNVKVVELFGAVGYDMNETDMLSIGSKLSAKVGGRFYPLPAPIYIGDDVTRKALIENPIIKNSLEMIDNCDLILSGLGAVDSNIPQRIWDIYLEDDVRKRIKGCGGVGFLCAHFFDENGEFLKIDVNDKIIGIKTESIKKNKIICVAGGLKKAKAIHAALKGNYIHTLISDDKTLRCVLEL